VAFRQLTLLAFDALSLQPSAGSLMSAAAEMAILRSKKVQKRTYLNDLGSIYIYIYSIKIVWVVV